MTLRPAVLFVRVPAVPAQIEAAWNAWYDEVHIEYRMDKPHFLGARRYRVLEGAPYCVVLYELASVAALTSPEYLAHRDWETAQPPGTFEAIGPKLPGFERGVYEQIHGPAGESAALETPAIFLAGYDPEHNEGEFARWCETTHARAILGMPGVAALRGFRLTEAALPTSTGVKTGRPKLLCAYYLASAAIGRSADFTRELDRAWQATAADGARCAILARSMYSVAASGVRR
ncbi:MAG: hypothetical protein IT531_24585 [Burkholderiales bacterium]|nr:hypothetical protein [Burkholderiales bacterium]